MPFKATLFIFDKQYPLIDAIHSLKQHVDISGRPTSKVLGGILKLLFVPTHDDTALLDAMISPTQMVKGYIRVYKRDGMSKDFDIEFANAFVILLTHTFNADNSVPFMVETHISPQIQRSRNTVFELSANPSNPFAQEQVAATVREEDTEPVVEEMYYTNLEGERIPDDQLQSGTEVYLCIKTRDAVGEIVDLELDDSQNDFMYNGEVLANDVLRDLQIKSEQQKIKLAIISQNA